MIDVTWGVGIAMQRMHKWAMSIWILSNGTSGGASNLLAHEDLELFEEAHHWNIQAKFYSVKVPTVMYEWYEKLSMKYKCYFEAQVWIFKKE